jgi:hypothetical protein
MSPDLLDALRDLESLVMCDMAMTEGDPWRSAWLEALLDRVRSLLGGAL